MILSYNNKFLHDNYKTNINLTRKGPSSKLKFDDNLVRKVYEGKKASIGMTFGC